MKFSKERGFAEIFKKIGAYFFDALYILILTVVVNFVGIAIVKNTSFYKEDTTTVNQNVDELYSLESDARLIDLYNLNEIKQDEPISQETQFQKYLYRHLLRCDDINGGALLGENRYQYISKNTKVVYETMINIMPVGQAYEIKNGRTLPEDSFEILWVYSSITSSILTIIGIIIFKRKDIN